MKTTMKRNLFATMFTAVLLMLGSFTAWAADYNGSLDGMEGGSVSGWACNASAPHTSANVQILVKNHDTKETAQDFTVFASEKRTDISNEGKLNDYCGFSADIDWSSHPEGTYDIEAYVDGEKLPNTLQYKNASDGGTVTQISENPSVSAVNAGNGSLRLKSLGTFRLTGYCKCRICCGKWSSINSTFTGAVPRANHTISVDPRVIPFGTKVMINGVIYTAEDKGGGVKGKHVDIFCNSHSEASRIGGRQEVFLIQ